MKEEIIIRQKTYDAYVGEEEYIQLGNFDDTKDLDNTQIVKLAHEQGLIGPDSRVSILGETDSVELLNGQIVNRRFNVTPMVVKDIEVCSNGDVSEENICLEVTRPNGIREHVYGNFNTVEGVLNVLNEQDVLDANCQVLIDNVSYVPGGLYTKAAVTFFDNKEFEIKILK